ncbi:hypothetical protein FA13DRAFT_1728960 [Coprinellus micaceus]|uniref:Uncharacterized protein n=1 Tax=Coprinellus micaceus TaxID=71717 RepID=A0A4Y7TMM1_COPMI|nr:hypothetical protein FA13DRAFT_1728960 [Coprinellus micaceus]
MSILSGVSIPEDVLNAIFKETVPQDMASAFPHSHLSPTVTGTGLRLWTLLSLQVQMFYDEMHLAEVITTKLIPQVRYWLNRCGEGGLYLGLKVSCHSVAISLLEAVIIENLSRFRALEITYLPFKAIADANSSVPLPLLHTLSIIRQHGEDTTHSLDMFDSWKGLSQSRTLRRLHVGGLSSTWIRLPQVPWAQPFLSATLLHDLLETCENLQYCIVATNGTSFPQLYRLDITFAGAGGIDALCHINFPSLRSFALRASGRADGSQRNLAPLSTFQNAFFSQLRNVRNLTIYTSPLSLISNETLIHFLRCTPELESLTLSCPQTNYTPLIIALSNDTDDGNDLLPCLRSFTLCLKFARYTRSVQCDVVLHIDTNIGGEKRKWKDGISQAYAEAAGGNVDAVVPFRCVEYAYDQCCSTDDEYGSPWAVTM